MTTTTQNGARDGENDMDRTLYVAITEYLYAGGINAISTAQGLAHAQQIGYATDDEALALALTRCVYVREDRRAGALYPVVEGTLAAGMEKA